ncbi:MAG TPA: hypothetical protein VKU89_00160 [Solirubrobacteraceae bacterium]|nr:hypothetical protein [Solirubrobacteraceae bacterium]
MEAYQVAKERCLEELREEVDNPARRQAPTVLEFAGATIQENGRIEPPRESWRPNPMRG